MAVRGTARHRRLDLVASGRCRAPVQRSRARLHKTRTRRRTCIWPARRRSPSWASAGNLYRQNSLLQSSERIKYFSKVFLDEGLQLTEDKVLLAIKQSDIFYNNGFWAARFDKNIFGCKEDLMIPFMSGFGGITVVFLPNSMMYYYFSDNFTFSWYSAVYAAHNIKPLC